MNLGVKLQSITLNWTNHTVGVGGPGLILAACRLVSCWTEVYHMIFAM